MLQPSFCAGIVYNMRYQRYRNGGNFTYLMLLFFLMFGGLKFILGLFGVVLVLIVQLFPIIIMGGIAYTVIKRIGRNRTINSSLNSRTADHKRFVELMVHMMIHLAKADGQVSEVETQMISCSGV